MNARAARLAELEQQLRSVKAVREMERMRGRHARSAYYGQLVSQIQREIKRLSEEPNDDGPEAA